MWFNYEGANGREGKQQFPNPVKCLRSSSQPPVLRKVGSHVPEHIPKPHTGSGYKTFFLLKFRVKHLSAITEEVGVGLAFILSMPKVS